ncbi:hypothetical protein [Christiangramia aestuarii]|nr:hypothetical protein [Christiangramia aestuarii]
MNLITIEHLRIFDQHGGNYESLERVGTNKEKELFIDNDIFEKIDE